MGIGSKLIESALKSARELGYRRMVLRTHKTNVAGIACYESNGFAQISETVFVSSYPLKFLAVNFEIDLTKKK